jgi:hypothetical protein
MTAKKPLPEPVELTTLRAANEWMPRLMPAPTAPPVEWLAFRRRSAAIYRHVADIDRRHHHEALYWAEREAVVAQELAEQIATAQRANEQRAKPSIVASRQDIGGVPP